jgi:hypothetical protein
MSSTSLQIVPETGETRLSRAIFPVTDTAETQRARIIGEFQPTTLAALSAVSLLNRVDT